MYVTSVCDDVTLTVRQALVRKKPSTWCWTINCRIRWTEGRQCSDKANQSDDDFIYPPEIGYYLTGDFSWADFKAADLKRWHGWTGPDFTSYGITSLAGTPCSRTVFPAFSDGSSGEVASQGYDPENQHPRLPCSITAKDGDLDFTAQPLDGDGTPPSYPQAPGDRLWQPILPSLTFQPEAVARRGPAPFGRTASMPRPSPCPPLPSVWLGCRRPRALRA